MPAAKVFIDSNTFLYARELSDTSRRLQAELWLKALTITLSGVTNLQVLNEVTNVLIRKASRFDTISPFDVVDTYADFGISPIDLSTIVTARSIFDRYRFSWWDCLLLASAIELGCTHFLSEDLQDGQAIEGLTIVSPFAHTPDQILISR